MYEEFYGLCRRPFGKTPDPGFLFLGKAHEEALARLQYAVEEKEIIMLTGEVGCGKTTLTRALTDSLDDSYRVILVLNPRLTPNQLLRLVAKRFGVEAPRNFKDSLLEALHEKVFRDYENGITPVIIIDEAQLVPSREAFEELRLLTNFQLDDTNLLSLVIVGQPGLRKRMDGKSYRPLKQRIGFFYHLEPLGGDEIKGYIEHRLAVAGRSNALFTRDAIALIYRCSGGIPRVINSIADTALLEGLGAERKTIDGSLVMSACRELGLEGYGNN
jgi:type II secretory pathway predicted ATPase ExeA